MGVPFKQEIRVGYGPLQMMHVVEGRGTGMARAYKAALEKRGIEVLLQTPAKELIVGDDGNIAGVLATDKQRNELRIKAKTVIIATGGYAGSNTLAGLLNPLYKGAFGVGNGAAAGDGLIMASKIGASITNTDLLMVVLKDYEILSKHRGNINSSSIYGFAQRCIYVGKAGKRFVPESDGSFMNQGMIEPVFEQMRKDRTDHIWAVNDHKNITASKARRGHDLEYLQAETLEGLADLMEVDSQGLVETVERWNTMATAGVDTELGRVGDLFTIDTAPYYAVAVVPAIPITYGGILRNQRGEVLRNDNTVVNGLYAAGEASGNSAYMGFTLSNAVTWGRIAGESAADYVKNGPRPEASVVAATPTAEDFNLKPGVYEGIARGHNGDLEVSVTVDESGITAVRVVAHEETEVVSDAAIEQVPAGIVEYQTTSVDAVSGATVTSRAIMEATAEAIETARRE
jgi:fumarate reductase flavoprotein subunit